MVYRKPINLSFLEVSDVFDRTEYTSGVPVNFKKDVAIIV